MAVKPTAPRVMSGTHGYVYWDNEVVFEVSSAESSVKTDREDVTFSGDMWKDSKLMGLGGEFTIKVRKVFSRAKKLAEAFSKRQEDCLLLGAGGCRICPVCAAAEEKPCRHPELACPSLESYGIQVSELAKRCGMNYLNGVNTVTYFGAVLK